MAEKTGSVLSFLGSQVRTKALPARRFWELREHEIPAKSGVYVLRAKPGVRFHYPKGDSRVFYIGRSANLRTGLRRHLRWAEEARSGHKDRPDLQYLNFPTYQYTAAFAHEYVTLPPWEKWMTAQWVENLVLAEFIRDYNSVPVANGRGNWGRLLHLTVKRPGLDA